MCGIRPFQSSGGPSFAPTWRLESPFASGGIVPVRRYSASKDDCIRCAPNIYVSFKIDALLGHDSRIILPFHPRPEAFAEGTQLVLNRPKAPAWKRGSRT